MAKSLPPCIPTVPMHHSCGAFLQVGFLVLMGLEAFASAPMLAGAVDEGILGFVLRLEGLADAGAVVLVPPGVNSAPSSSTPSQPEALQRILGISPDYTPVDCFFAGAFFRGAVVFRAATFLFFITTPITITSSTYVS